MKKNGNDLRLWLADTKYGVVLLLVFYCVSQPLAIMQRIKQNWGIPAFHELRYISSLLEFMKVLQNLRTFKEIRQLNHPALRALISNIKQLDSYKFGGVIIDHSPARFTQCTINDLPVLTRTSEPTLRDIVSFMNSYASYVLEYIPPILKECTHPWSSLAVLTIDPVTLLECITGTKDSADLITDDNAIQTVVKSEQPWKDLVQLVLDEDPRLSDILGIHYENGNLLKHVRQQIANCIFNKKLIENSYLSTVGFKK